MKCFPSGRNHGQRWVVCFSLSSTVAGEGVPPCALTFNKASRKSALKTITSSALHVPPRGFGASAKAETGPPDAAILFNFPLAKNATYRPSGDQKGCIAP